MSKELTDQELNERIAELHREGFALAAKSLEREKSFRAKMAG